MMNAFALQQKLLDYTIANSGAESRRYLGMSHIADCSRKLFNSLTNPAPALTWPMESHLRCYAGYLWERDVKVRLQALGLYVPGSERELVADFDQRFKGHTDGEISGEQPGERHLLEVKSTTLDKLQRIMADKRLPIENYQQVQVYLRHGGYTKAYVVYVCRDTGEMHVAEVSPNGRLQADLDLKARRVLAAVDAGQSPRCECGRCR
jgi:hypothetical protein